MAKAVVAIAGCVMLLMGCINFPNDTTQRSLVDVVDAIQYAVEEISRDEVWEATAAEQRHWNQACELVRKSASESCVAMLFEADKACRTHCAGGSCGLASQELCRKLVTGDDRVALCAGPLKNQAWCASAATCADHSRNRNRICEAAASISHPELKEAVVTLATEEAVQASAKVKVMVVAFGGGRGKASTNAVKLQLLPRVRSKDYASDGLPPLDRLPAMPSDRVISQEARAFASELKVLLASAVSAAVREQEGGSIARPPMALGAFDVEVALTVTRDGKLGIEKAWTTPVAGIDLGTSASAKTINSLKVSFARKP